MPGQLYVLSGPSGAGKSTIINRLREKVSDLGYSISHTTRKPRGSEVNGIHYHFIDKKAFKGMAEAGDFVEWAEVYNDFYGTSILSLKRQIEKGSDVIMDLDVQGAKNIKHRFESSILIFILPPSLEALAKRLKKRATDSKAVIEKRLGKAIRELKKCIEYDYLIFNENLDITVQKFESIIISDRCRKSNMLPEVERVFRISSH